MFTPSRGVWTQHQGLRRLRHTHRIFRIAVCNQIIRMYVGGWCCIPQNCDNPDVGWPPRGKKRRSPSTETTTVRMTTKEDGKEATREPGSNPFPVSRVQKILKADTVKHLPGEWEVAANNEVDSNSRWSRKRRCFSSLSPRRNSLND